MLVGWMPPSPVIPGVALGTSISLALDCLLVTHWQIMIHQAYTTGLGHSGKHAILNNVWLRQMCFLFIHLFIYCLFLIFLFF